MKKEIDILIIRISSLGDVILTTHLPRIIKTSYPKARIDILTQDINKEIYLNNPYINNLLLYNKLWNSKEIKEFKYFVIDKKEKKYDIVIDLQNNFRSLELRYQLGKKIYSIRKRRLHKLFLVNIKKSPLKDIPIPDIYFETTKKALEIANDNLGLEVWLEKENGINYLSKKNTDKDIIVIAPGAKHFTKRWLPEYYAELIKKLMHKYNKKIYLIGNSEESDLCEKIRKLSECKAENLAGRFSILETIDLIDNAGLVICNDSATVHMSSARKTPVVVIYGSTNISFGFAPYQNKNVIISKELSCKPCTHIGRSECPKSHFNCMKEITSDEVLEKAALFL